jgi:hypothetical protein
MANKIVATVISNILESNQDEDYDHLMSVLEEVGLDVRCVDLETTENALANVNIKDVISDQTNIVFATCLLAADKVMALRGYLLTKKWIYWGCDVCVFDDYTRSACDYLLQRSQKQNHKMMLKHFIAENFQKVQ